MNLEDVAKANMNAIVERCEQFTRDNLQQLAFELSELKKLNRVSDDSKLNELCNKITLIGLTQPALHIAIAMISNECVNFVASQKPEGEAHVAIHL